MYRRHRAGGAPAINNGNNNNNDDDDDDEEDVFSALARRRPKKKAKGGANNNNNSNEETTVNNAMATAAPATAPFASQSSGQQLPPQNNKTTTSDKDQASAAEAAAASVASTTSSMKRHHKEMSHHRKAKMDAMLHELQWEQQDNDNNNNRRDSGSRSRATMGSHVEPGQEHLTTNLFVGNLAPNLTEEDVSHVFGQFGELYSVKIMWPRTAQERARQRLTGFVCYWNRPDAEEAMAAFSEADPFRSGRRLMLRWGKSVLKEGAAAKKPSRESSSSRPPQQAQHFGIGADPSRQPSAPQQQGRESTAPQRQRATASHHRIQVKIPPNQARAQFISLVASFVAKDGADLEERLLLEQRPDMQFLTYQTQQTQQSHQQDLNNNDEHIYYKWRVYSYCQGDGEFTWRTEPFGMVQHGCTWVPPPLPPGAAQKERERLRALEEERRQQRMLKREHQSKRPPPPSSRSSHTQPMHGGRRQGSKPLPQQQQRSSSSTLDAHELQEFHALTQQHLSTNREAIARAMAFCFEKSHAAQHICRLLRELLLLEEEEQQQDDTETAIVSVDTCLARLYLLSDILFNSQQPGVRNAFYYRDEIEQMAPDVFDALGRHCRGEGRLTAHKMTQAVSRVLAAWTNWSVYSPAFLDELQARYEGREIVKKDKEEEENTKDDMDDEEAIQAAKAAAEEAEHHAKAAGALKVGDWKDVHHDEEDEEEEPDQTGKDTREASSKVSNLLPSPPPPPAGEDADGEPIEDNNDDDPDGIPLNEEDDDPDADGEPLEEEDVDGEPLADPDGEPLEEEDDPDGEPL